MFGNKTVQIFLGRVDGENMPFDKAHGVLWARPLVKDEQSGYEIKTDYCAVPFRVDQRRNLAVPRSSTIRSIFDQARKLGLELLHVELNVKGETKYYAHP